MPVSSTWPQRTVNTWWVPIGWRIFPFFLKNIFWKKEYNICNFRVFLGDTIRQKKKRKSKRTIKIITIAYYIYMNGCLRFSTFMFLNIAKFWLTILMEDHRHLSNITKTKKTTWVHVVGPKAWGARLCWNRLRALEAELRGAKSLWESLAPRVLHGVKIVGGFFNKIPIYPEGIWWVPTRYHQKEKNHHQDIAPGNECIDKLH